MRRADPAASTGRRSAGSPRPEDSPARRPTARSRPVEPARPVASPSGPPRRPVWAVRVRPPPTARSEEVPGRAASSHRERRWSCARTPRAAEQAPGRRRCPRPSRRGSRRPSRARGAAARVVPGRPTAAVRAGRRTRRGTAAPPGPAPPGRRSGAPCRVPTTPGGWLRRSRRRSTGTRPSARVRRTSARSPCGRRRCTCRRGGPSGRSRRRPGHPAGVARRRGHGGRRGTGCGRSGGERCPPRRRRSGPARSSRSRRRPPPDRRRPRRRAGRSATSRPGSPSALARPAASSRRTPAARSPARPRIPMRDRARREPDRARRSPVWTGRSSWRATR
ncbi:hypothetical protein EV378_5508 [Pseudonocardia endophytica]|uniref:Uncharacterized protein n=1 Tax=Pseudonocardia endophytica TaxID=401976 RepID=A0A4R1HMG8_PSEEN|nr:hypothetical protein EV378_5508 [Pseudonocardia endophytica]